MKSRILSAVMLSAALFAGSADAQEARNAARKVEIYYSPYGVVRAGGSNRQGGCSGVAMTDSVALVGEFCGTHQFVSRKQVDSLLSYRGGVRFSRRTGSLLTTFARGVAGGESGYRNAGFANNSGFSFDAGGGVDVGLKNWLGLRIVQANYQMTRVGGATVNGFRLGAGLVFRIGKREEITKMKLKALLLAAGLASFAGTSYAQDISGDWQGTSIAGQQKLLSIVKIAKAPDGWSAKLSNPDQGNDAGQSTPIDAITLQGQDVKLTVAAIQGRYEGKLSADGNSIEGTWTQGGQARPVVYTMVYQRATPETAWRDPSPHTSQFVTVDKDVQLEVLDWGGNGKPLVFLAGAGNTAHVFDKFAPRFAAAHHVYGITRRGFGASSVPATGYSADRLGDDVLAVLDFLKLSRPVLAGHSLGGEELSSIGSRFPDKVAGLIYLDAGYEYAFYDKARGSLFIDLAELRRKLVEFEPGKQPADPRPLLKELLETILPAFERSLKQTQTDLDGMRPAEIAALAEDPGSPVEQAIQAGFQKYTIVSAPILAIFASPHKGPTLPPNAPARILATAAAMAAREAATTEAQVKAFESGLPSAKVIRLPGADHYIFISDEAEVLREMNSFLATLP